MQLTSSQPTFEIIPFSDALLVDTGCKGMREQVVHATCLLPPKHQHHRRSPTAQGIARAISMAHTTGASFVMQLPA